jgi:ribosome biogenesis GTPase A
MSSIRWFPGHMATARTKAAETMRKTDLVIEILDARVPRASCNPGFESLRRAGQRPAVKVLNKADLAEPAETERWLRRYNARPDVRAIAISAKQPGDLRRLLRACKDLRPDRGTVVKPLRMMILGIPNVGKSTLMNALLKRHVAHVGDEPAITKTQMFHELAPGLTLVDTPGMLWPEMEEDTAFKLAATHSIGRAAYDDQDVALALGRTLIARHLALLGRRFGVLPAGCDAHGLLEAIAAGRHLVGKQGGPDLARAAGALLNDFRSGALGRITLETVDEVPESTGSGAGATPAD